MYSKTIFFSAFFCIVKAAIIINVFDDVPDTQSTYSLRDCNEEKCEVICGWLDFPSGFCLNGHCKCNNWSSADQNEKDKFDAIVLETARSCSYQECDQRCRRLGFTGGACVNGRCKCDNFLSEDKTVEDKFDPIVPETARSCSYQECDQRCRRLGFTGGACVNGRCKCDNSVSEDKTVEDKFDPTVPETARSCYYQECEQRCRRLGFTGGACVNGRCKCDNFLSEDKTAEDGFDLIASETTRNCYYRECDQRCRRLGFTGGACVNGRCKCDNFLNTEYRHATQSESWPRRQEIANVAGLALPSASQQPATLADIPKFTDSFSVNNCYRRWCIFQCRLRGFNGGICINGNCKCDNGEEVESTSPK